MQEEGMVKSVDMTVFFWINQIIQNVLKFPTIEIEFILINTADVEILQQIKKFRKHWK